MTSSPVLHVVFAQFWQKKRKVDYREEENRTMRKPNENGQALAEYSLILALIVVVGIAALMLFGGGVLGLWSDFVDSWPA